MIPTLRITTVLSSRIAVSILLLCLGRQSFAQADPLEQALKRYIKNPEVADMFRKAVAYLPENPPVKSNYKEQLAQAIERAAVVKRDGGGIDQQLEVTAILGRALTTSWQLNASNPAIVKEVQAVSKRMVELNGSATALKDTVIWKAIDESAAPAPGGDSHAASPSQASVPAPKLDAMQQAIAAIGNPMQRAQAQQVLDRMHPEVRQALERIVAELGRRFQTSPVPFARGLLIGLTVELNRAPGSPPPGAGLQAAVEYVKQAATFPDAVGSVASSLNAITRHSRTYTDVDWELVLLEYSHDHKSDYLEANLQKMLSESLRSSMSQAQPATPATAR